MSRPRLCLRTSCCYPCLRLPLSLYVQFEHIFHPCCNGTQDQSIIYHAMLKFGPERIEISSRPECVFPYHYPFVDHQSQATLGSDSTWMGDHPSDK
jgi:hypothetical protein